MTDRLRRIAILGPRGMSDYLLRLRLPDATAHVDLAELRRIHEVIGAHLGLGVGRCAPGPLLEGYPTHRTAAGAWFVRGEHCCAWGPSYAPDACSEAWDG